jgi:hypothetical protein
MPTREQAIVAIIAHGQERCLPLSVVDFLKIADDVLIGEMNLIESQNHWSPSMERLAQQLAGPEARALPRP